ncbi:unnamed protein product [Amoebophrya sp. A25]|nr:unnamed protein product [Amoebophrya sp. A25]|eukprot:GSA25T00015443001.1
MSSIRTEDSAHPHVGRKQRQSVHSRNKKGASLRGLFVLRNAFRPEEMQKTRDQAAALLSDEHNQFMHLGGNLPNWVQDTLLSGLTEKMEEVLERGLCCSLADHEAEGRSAAEGEIIERGTEDDTNTKAIGRPVIVPVVVPLDEDFFLDTRRHDGNDPEKEKASDEAPLTKVKIFEGARTSSRNRLCLEVYGLDLPSLQQGYQADDGVGESLTKAFETRCTGVTSKSSVPAPDVEGNHASPCVASDESKSKRRRIDDEERETTEHASRSHPKSIRSLSDQAEAACESLMHNFFDFDQFRESFDSMIVNRYYQADGECENKGGGYLKPHLDLLRFGHCILGFSLCGKAVMQFFEILPKSQNKGGTCSEIIKPRDLVPGDGDLVLPGEEQRLVEDQRLGKLLLSLRLNPGDVYILTESARYAVAHGIHSVEGERISVTVRQ